MAIRAAEKRWKGAERGAGGRAAAKEQGAGVTKIGWSVERIFRRSHDLDACYSLLCLRCRISDVWHVGTIVRLVFVAVHYPRECNNYPGWLMHTEKGCTLHGLNRAWHRPVMIFNHSTVFLCLCVLVS